MNAAFQKPQESRTLRELIEEGIAQIDQNPALSPEERAIAQKTLESLEVMYGTKVLNVKTRTGAALVELQQEIRATMETATMETSLRERSPQRTDMVDLNAMFAGIVRRFQIDMHFKKTIENLRKGGKEPELVSKIETIGDFRKLPVETLIELEGVHEGILLFIFTDAVDAETKIDLEKFYWTPREGAQLRVDFRGNMEAEERIGAADLLPPSVRRITVYEKGNTNLARTSDRRIGLKGRNQDGTGFFDQDGYIPIYSGDVVVIGGIDLAFERKYRTGVSMLDYEAYERNHAVQEKTFVEKLQQSDLPTKKQYSPKEPTVLESRIEASDIRQRIVSAATELLKEKKPALHCWDWVRQVYERAGAKRQRVYWHGNYNKKERIRGHADFNDNPENPPSVIAALEAGDHVFIHNRNNADRRGDHSILFLHWLDRTNLIGQAMSCPGSGRPGRIHKVDFKKTPLTLAMKPMVTGEVRVS